MLRGRAATRAGRRRRRRSRRAACGRRAAALGALVDALADELGDRVRYGARVARVDAGVGGGVVRVDGERWDACVLAIPAPRAAGWSCACAELAARLARVRARAGGARVSRLREAAMGGRDAVAKDGFGFLVAQGEELRVLGVVFESTVWPGRAPAGQVLLRCIFGGGRDPDAAGLERRRADRGRAARCRRGARRGRGADARERGAVARGARAVRGRASRSRCARRWWRRGRSGSCSRARTIAARG